jgi:hypothetical protein
MTQLIKYEAARAALAEARTVDEVKDIRDKAEAIRAYARMAKDVQLELDAGELRVRAERELGLRLIAEKASGGLPSHRPKKCPDRGQLTLEDLDISRNLSARCQKIASIPEPAFEASVARVRERITARQGMVSLDITAIDKKERRAERERKLGEKQSADSPAEFDAPDEDAPLDIKETAEHNRTALVVYAGTVIELAEKITSFADLKNITNEAKEIIHRAAVAWAELDAKIGGNRHPRAARGPAPFTQVPNGVVPFATDAGTARGRSRQYAKTPVIPHATSAPKNT